MTSPTELLGSGVSLLDYKPFIKGAVIVNQAISVRGVTDAINNSINYYKSAD